MSGILIEENPLKQRIYLPPQTKFVACVSDRFENFFRRTDDAIIQWSQRHLNRFWIIFNMSITFFTSIEFGCAVPIVFLFCNLDGLVSEYIWLMLVATLISQIPKRFLWRRRPFMTGRAKKVIDTKTSSFPSRAVLCSVIYLYFIVYFLQYQSHDADVIIKWWIPIIVVAVIFLSGWARVQLGVHYPSDCLVGGLLGIVCVGIAYLLHEQEVFLCLDCTDGSCYSPDPAHTITWKAIGRANWGIFTGITVLGLILVFFFSLRPLKLWFKSHCIIGMLTPVFCFNIGFLCPLLPNPCSLHNPGDNPTFGDFLAGTIVASITAAFGMWSASRLKDPSSSATIIEVDNDESFDLSVDGHRALSHRIHKAIHDDEESLVVYNFDVVSKTKETSFAELKAVLNFIGMHTFVFMSLLWWRLK
ncbi:hypothetical protein PCE1_001788 [Barthelona sp. PCE]